MTASGSAEPVLNEFHLLSLDFPLDDLSSLPSYRLALVCIAHPLASSQDRDRAELLFARARERDRNKGFLIGDERGPGQRTSSEDTASAQSQNAGPSLLTHVKAEPGTEGQAEQSFVTEFPAHG